MFIERSSVTDFLTDDPVRVMTPGDLVNDVFRRTGIVLSVAGTEHIIMWDKKLTLYNEMSQKVRRQIQEIVDSDVLHV